MSIGAALARLAKRDKNLCHICRKPVSKAERSRDHVVPRSRGGSSARANLALAHIACNQARGVAPVATRVTPRGWRKA